MKPIEIEMEDNSEPVQRTVKSLQKIRVPDSIEAKAVVKSKPAVSPQEDKPGVDIRLEWRSEGRTKSLNRAEDGLKFDDGDGRITEMITDRIMETIRQDIVYKQELPSHEDVLPDGIEESLD